MSLVFCVFVDVFLCKTAKKDAVETRVESVQVGATHVTDTRLGLGRRTQGITGVGREQGTKGIKIKAGKDKSIILRKSSEAGQNFEA